MRKVAEKPVFCSHTITRGFAKVSSKLSVFFLAASRRRLLTFSSRRQMSRGHSAGQSAASGCNAACHDNTQSLLPISVFRLGRWNDRGLTVVGPALLRGEEKHTGFLWPNMSSLLWVHVSLLDSPSIIQKHQDILSTNIAFKLLH